MAKFDRPPPWRNPRKGRDQILLRSVAEPYSRSPKGQTHTILKSGYRHLATLGGIDLAIRGNGELQSLFFLSFRLMFCGIEIVQRGKMS